ncbi:TetR/AcrR family transcriptional regulator [Prescottella defluvii]|uniref:TetR/AcrR family transcriptional regulator n=1 Tax=Prescottella defluvii TaxID=1323361 RepID=UPI0004F289D4|nr:TetR/AcrR family transcriptional regulator [Prescottella defluvii]
MATSSQQRPARAKILDAASALFTTTGYAATTIKQIAARACVSSQSVYFVFGNKRSVLSSLLDASVAGDDEPVATLQREWVADAIAAPDPSEQLRIQIHHARLILDRVADTLLAVRAAAAADAEVAELWRTNLDQRRTVQQHLMEALAGKADGVDTAAAVDVALALLSPETYTQLVRDGDWSPERYEQWVHDTVAAAAGI